MRNWQIFLSSYKKIEQEGSIELVVDPGRSLGLADHPIDPIIFALMDIIAPFVHDYLENDQRAADSQSQP